VRLTSSGIVRSTSKAAEHVSDTSGACLTAEQLTKHEKVCSFCTVSAFALVASVPAAWPDARDAVRGLRRH
jgi:hypothetical protein